MPRDADYGRELASQLQSKYSGWINDVAFTYDTYLELDHLDPTKSYCRIGPSLYSETRESRAIWMESIQLIITLVSAADLQEAKVVDDWLDSWDLLIRETRDLLLFDKVKVLGIDREDRYDRDMFHNNKRLLTQAEINFKNVEIQR